MTSLVLFISLFSLSSFAAEVGTKDFFFCQQKKATNIELRTIRIHKFSNLKKCIVVYSVQGQDTLFFQGPWLLFCRKKARNLVKTLEKDLWKCRSQETGSVFYSGFTKGIVNFVDELLFSRNLIFSRVGRFESIL